MAYIITAFKYLNIWFITHISDFLTAYGTHDFKSIFFGVLVQTFVVIFYRFLTIVNVFQITPYEFNLFFLSSVFYHSRGSRRLYRVDYVHQKLENLTWYFFPERLLNIFYMFDLRLGSRIKIDYLRRKNLFNPNHVAALSNISLETLVPNLMSLTRPSLQILGKTQTGVFLISGFLVNPL